MGRVKTLSWKTKQDEYEQTALMIAANRVRYTLEIEWFLAESWSTEFQELICFMSQQLYAEKMGWA